MCSPGGSVRRTTTSPKQKPTTANVTKATASRRGTPIADTKIAIRLATTTGSPTKLKIHMPLKPPATLVTSLGIRRSGLMVRIHVPAADTTTTTKSRWALTAIPVGDCGPSPIGAYRTAANVSSRAASPELSRSGRVHQLCDDIYSKTRPRRAGIRTCRRSRRPWSRPSRPSAPAPSGTSSTGSCAR